MADDVPEPFGYKVCWLAVRSRDRDAVSWSRRAGARRLDAAHNAGRTIPCCPNPGAVWPARRALNACAPPP